MALCRVVPGLRSCGVPVAVAAWYPWKTQHGLLAVDSCAIFFVGQAAVGQFRLQYDLEDLHDRDSTGLLWKESMVTEALIKEIDEQSLADPSTTYPYHFHRHLGNVDVGPGFHLRSYGPAATSDVDKLRMLLTPAQETVDAVASTAGKGGNGKGKGVLFQAKQKWLEIHKWRIAPARHHRGSHFPLCVYTHGANKRSPQKNRQRARRQRERKAVAAAPEDSGVPAAPMPGPGGEDVPGLCRGPAAVAAAAPVEAWPVGPPAQLPPQRPRGVDPPAAAVAAAAPCAPSAPPAAQAWPQPPQGMPGPTAAGALRPRPWQAPSHSLAAWYPSHTGGHGTPTSAVAEWPAATQGGEWRQGAAAAGSSGDCVPPPPPTAEPIGPAVNPPPPPPTTVPPDVSDHQRLLAAMQNYRYQWQWTW